MRTYRKVDPLDWRGPSGTKSSRQIFAFSRPAPSGGNPSWKIRPFRWPAASGGNLSRKLLFFVCKTYILCVSRVLHMKSALGASRWDAHQKVSMTVASFIWFCWDSARIRTKLVRILINVTEIRKLTLASMCLVPSTWYQVLGTKYLVPSNWYQALGTKYFLPSTWYQVFCNNYFVPSTWYQILCTKYLVPSTW